MKLEEVGQTKVLSSIRGRPTVKVIMCIKAPRGIMQIYEPMYPSLDTRSSDNRKVQCQAIKAFMKRHNA